MSDFFEIIVVFVALGVLLHRYLTSTFDFWEKRDIPGPRPKLIFGNAADILKRKVSMGQFERNIYSYYKNEPAVGLFFGKNPVLLLRDPEMIKSVLIKDFSKFSDRGMVINEKLDPLSVHLIALDPERWRVMRTKLTPTFSTGKLKDMFFSINECSLNLEKYLTTLVSTSESIEIRELAARFTTDVIGRCAFGIEINSLMEAENEFRRQGCKIFQPNSNIAIRFRIQQFSPWLAAILGYLFCDNENTQFFMDLTLGAMEYRKKHKIVKNDFINTLLELKENPSGFGNIPLTDNLLVAQALAFFAAGFETSASTISHALYELALNQDIQEKLYEEVKEAYKSNEGNLTYDNMNSMKYLDKVFKETLRKYPVIFHLTRKSLTSYKFDEMNLSIPEKQLLVVPVLGIHYDPAIYPFPEIFDPERFSEEAVRARHPMQYLPFGAGPRNCIGARFGNYQSKIGILRIIKNYQVDVCDKTPIPYIADPRSFLLTPLGGIHLKFTKRQNDRMTE